MKYQDILDMKRKVEFNLTESETLVKLVSDAQIKGEKAQKEMDNLRKKASKIADFFEKEQLVFDEKALENVTLQFNSAVGIDGSFQLVGGAGGLWYSPISVARVIFLNGLGSQPKVDIFWAGIEEIQESNLKPEFDAAIKMLTGETKAIMDWGGRRQPAFAFIDGPIVDPPAYSNDVYVEYRCEALKACLRDSKIIGCVKRSRDTFYIEELKKREGLNKKSLESFPSDQHLMAYVFGHLRYKGYKGPIFTRLIDISGCKFINNYASKGLRLYCFFFQNNVSSQVLRVDFAVPTSFDKIDNELFTIAKAVKEWTYPGQDYPLPVFLAHNKCNIREGCAEVLYDEIMTRSKSSDPLNQTISIQLR